MTKTQKIFYYVLLVVVSLMFVMSGYMKVSANPTSVEGFLSAHLPIWFMYFIGVAEILGGIGLWIPKLQKWAVWGLEIIMVGAVVVTVLNQPAWMALMPVLFGAALWYICKMGAKNGSAPVAAPVNSAPKI